MTQRFNNVRYSEKKDAKRKEAEARQATRSGRSIDQQLELLRQRAGNSTKEVARLLALKEGRIITCFPTIDKILEGGIPAGEMLVIVAKPTRKSAKERKSAEKKVRPGHQE